ncbi:MAG: hypothetical protein Q7T51_03130 [Candidatus Moranbacteria bacterium]|nr:hypothetical protein [Candidatus Moranbacteria bacterium]
MQDYNNQGNQSEQDKRRKLTDIQRNIIMAEADLKKVTNEKMMIESAMSRTKREIDHLKLGMQAEEQKLKKIEQDMMMKQVEISKLKKQLNSVQ